METLAPLNKDWAKVLTTVKEELLDQKDYPRVLGTLIGIASGFPWSQIVETGLSRPEYVMLKQRSKIFRAAAKEAESIADEVKQSIREEEAHGRAVDGETIPAFNMKGEIVGTYKKRSDKLMELLLKAGDREKYGDRRSDTGTGQVVLSVNFAIPSRVPTIEVKGELHDVEESPNQIGPEESETGNAGTTPTGNGRQHGNEPLLGSSTDNNGRNPAKNRADGSNGQNAKSVPEPAGPGTLAPDADRGAEAQADCAPKGTKPPRGETPTSNSTTEKGVGVPDIPGS